MKNCLKLPFYMAMGAMLLVTSCDNDDNGYAGDLTPRESAIQGIVADYTAHTVIPTYRNLADKTIDLYNACRVMYTAGSGNVTTEQVQTAGDAWKSAREYWERSEAWLFGPAGDYDVDPHIDSWPLDENALKSLLANASEMSKMDADGLYISTKDYGLLGFHALEYMLFALEGEGMAQTSKPHATGYTAQELSYLTGVAGDLRNQCIILEAAWAGEQNISEAKRAVLNQIRTTIGTSSSAAHEHYKEALTALANGLCYANDMNNPVEGNNSDFVNYLAAAQTMISDGIQNIANEVGNVKIGNPTGQGSGEDYNYDPGYIESPYSLNSINDFKGNIISIENAYCGIQTSKAYNQGETNIKPVSHSLSSYVATLDAALDTKVKAAIDNAYQSVSQMKEPFAYTCNQANGYGEINKKAIDACNELNDIFDDVLSLLGEQR